MLKFATVPRPSSLQPYFDVIDRAVDSMFPLYKTFLAILEDYGFASFEAWVHADLCDDDIFEIVEAYMVSPLSEGVVPLSSNGKPYQDINHAKMMLLSWVLYRDFETIYPSWYAQFREMNPEVVELYTKNEKFAIYIETVRLESRRRSSEHWIWEVQSANCWFGMEAILLEKTGLG